MLPGIRNLIMRLTASRFGRAGHGLIYHPFSSRFRGYRNIYIGDRVYIGHRADFSVHVRLDIGDDVLFGPEVMILSGNHPFDIVGQTINASHKGINGRCRIEGDVWIGARAIIIGDVTIGEGAVVGAGSLVNRDVPPYTVAVGSPCVPRRRRFSDAELCEHLAQRGRPESFDTIIALRDAAFAARADKDPQA